MGALKIYMRQTPQLDFNGNPAYYVGSSPATMTRVTGTLPIPRQWPNYNQYKDVSGDVGNLQQIQLTWTNDRDISGQPTPGAYQPKKGASGTITIEGDTFFLLKKWLMDDISSPLNAVDVKIYDTGCNLWYEDYQIKSTDLLYCESRVCEFDISLKQRDEQMNCIRTTLIDDNWQGWFPDDGKPANGKKHPRFAYCNEIRPNGTLVLMWKLASWTFILTNTVVIPLVILLNGVFAVINAIIWVIRRFTKTVDYIDYIDPGDIIDGQERSLIDAAGCSREHPAPLIRDYISNVCDKCGVNLSSSSIPIFFDPVLKIETSTGYEEMQNPYIYACYLFAQNQRGIRRLNGATFFDYLRKPDYNDDEYWIKDNAPFMTLDMFLDKLKPVFNAEWRVYQGTLYFDRKDRFTTDEYVFDLSQYGKDRNQIIEGVCFEYNTIKVPASIKGLYDADAADTCGNEARKQYDSAVNFGNAADNPLVDGLIDKTTQIGAAKFRCDGASTDYIYDACQQNVNSGFFTNMFGVWKNVMAELNKTYEYALLLKDHTATLPKIIIWDAQNYNSAAATRFYHAGVDIFTSTAGGAPPMPNPNPPYNNYPTVRTWQQIHDPLTFVKGSNVIPQDYPYGKYTVRSYVGNIISQQSAMLVNYPMYFASEFKGSLWDLFHWIDDPKRNPKSGMQWSAKLQLCCDNLNKLGVGGIGADIKLGGRVKLPLSFFPDGKIKEITLSYAPDNEQGAYIEIKGE